MEKIRNWWKRFNMTPVERYLSNAIDHYDLEQSQRELARKGLY